MRELSRARLALAGIASAAAILAGALAVVIVRQRAAAAAFPVGARYVTCNSPSLGGQLPTSVYLPSAYANGSLRFPVIYFLHGLPASTTSYQAQAFVARAVAAGGLQAIVVVPQGSRSAGSDREYLDWGRTENWPEAIAHDLTSCIDSRFHTVAARAGRALIGLSAGGYGAFNVGLRRMDRFAAVESWSGYFEATDPSGRHKLDLGSARANQAASVPRGRQLKASLAELPTFIGFYVGRQDDRFLADNVELDKAFAARHIPHLFRIYQGAHTGSLWNNWAPLWVRLALDHLARPRQAPGG
jgi:enterochelin esterase-like enzyme